MTRRLRRELGLAVPWGVHTFLSMAKEKCAKESQRHGDSRGGPPRCASRASVCGSPTGCPRPRFAALTRREKGFYCPFWRRGSLCRAQHDWPDFTCDPARSELAFFCRQNGRAFFPPLPIAALAPRGRRRAYSTNASWDVTAQVGWLRCIHKQTCFPAHSWRWTYLTGAAWDVSMRLGWFRSAKNRLDFFLLPLTLSMLNQRRLG